MPIDELVQFLYQLHALSNLNICQVIQRKLVHVSTPSTVTDGSVGPDAVHLLAIKEVIF